MNPDVAPVSGRRRAAPPARRRSVAKPAAIVATVLVAALLLAGGLRATVFAPSSITRAALLSTGQPVISTAVGLLGLDGPRVQVNVTDAGRRPVFIGIGRAADVEAYLAQVSRVEVTGQDGDGRLLTERRGTEPSLPDPAGVDIWVTSARGIGSAALTWPETPGQWRMVVATDGTAAAPSALRLTWSGK